MQVFEEDTAVLGIEEAADVQRVFTVYSQTDFTCLLRSASVWTTCLMCTEVSRYCMSVWDKSCWSTWIAHCQVCFSPHTFIQTFTRVILGLYVRRVTSILQQITTNVSLHNTADVYGFNIDSVTWDLILSVIFGLAVTKNGIFKLVLVCSNKTWIHFFMLQHYIRSEWKDVNRRESHNTNDTKMVQTILFYY